MKASRIDSSSPSGRAGTLAPAAPAEDPQERAAQRSQRITEYEDTLFNPYIAAERGYVDAVIRPAETRSHVTRALRALPPRRRPRRRTAMRHRTYPSGYRLETLGPPP